MSYIDYNSTKIFESSHLNETVDANGQVVRANQTKLTHYKINLAQTEGMRRMKTKDLGRIHDELIKSNVDARLYTYIINNQSKKSKLTKQSSAEAADVKYLSFKFAVSERKIQKFIAEAIELEFIRKIGKEFFINPYLCSPFKINNDELHQLQIWWISSPEREIEFLEKQDMIKAIMKSSDKILGDLPKGD